jgi:drug/metabolite transporter (DMT)-like permease
MHSAVESSSSERERKVAVALSLTAALLYGSQYVAIKEGIKGFSPLLFGALTMGLGGLLALTLVIYRKSFSWGIFLGWDVLAGVVVTAGLIAFQNAGLSLSPASLGGLIVGSSIIFVAPISSLFFGEKLGARKMLAVFVGLLGLITLTTKWNLSTLASGTFLGYLLLTAASLCIALSYPITRLALRRLDPIQWAMAFHLLVPIPLLALAFLFNGSKIYDLGQLPFLLYVGVFCTALPTMLWAKGLEKISFITSATILMAESAFAVVLGILLLGEQLDWISLLGAALIFVAIFLAAMTGINRRNGKKNGV